MTALHFGKELQVESEKLQTPPLDRLPTIIVKNTNSRHQVNTIYIEKELGTV